MPIQATDYWLPLVQWSPLSSPRVFLVVELRPTVYWSHVWWQSPGDICPDIGAMKMIALHNPVGRKVSRIWQLSERQEKMEQEIVHRVGRVDRGCSTSERSLLESTKSWNLKVVTSCLMQFTSLESLCPGAHSQVPFLKRGLFCPWQLRRALSIKGLMALLTRKYILQIRFTWFLSKQAVYLW